MEREDWDGEETSSSWGDAVKIGYTHRMFRTLLTVLFLTVLSTLGFAGNAKSNSLTVYDLKKDGWWVVEKKSYVKVRPGEHSYSNLKRYVQVVVYILQKAEKQQKCIMEYDSQNDTLIEESMKFWVLGEVWTRYEVGKFQPYPFQF